MSESLDFLYSGLHKNRALELLRTGHFSDFTIKCGTTIFNIHKHMLMAKCGYFRSFVEQTLSGSTPDKVTLRVTLEETTPYAVLVMLAHIYLGMESSLEQSVLSTIRDDVDQMMTSTSSLERAVDIYILAGRLGIRRLESEMDKQIGGHIQDLKQRSRRLASLRKQKRCHLYYDAVELIYKRLSSSDALLRPTLTAFVCCSESYGSAVWMLAKAHDAAGLRVGGIVNRAGAHDDFWEEVWTGSVDGPGFVFADSTHVTIEDEDE